MSSTLPFAVAPDAADYLRDQLAHPRQGEEPALITVLAQGDDARCWFEGEHYMIGYYGIGQRPEAQHIELLGYQVSIIPETLERLSGRTLTLRSVVVRCGWFKKVTRYVLVAG
jgi:hypothetical protein